MQRIRYTGPDEARVLGIGIEFPRMKWVDLEKEAAKHGIRSEHVAILQRGLLIQEDWEAEGPVKAARTRKANEQDNDQETDQ